GIGDWGSGIGDRGSGIGDRGLGIGDWGSGIGNVRVCGLQKYRLLRGRQFSKARELGGKPVVMGDMCR
ncbi:hypothetical protein, partial [Xanthomonas nasturtii]|uniref:hypothetical protein n=1 Tax=Xanthomonas nasturtii TaxID=1843581 RepID=UPI0020113445